MFVNRGPHTLLNSVGESMAPVRVKPDSHFHPKALFSTLVHSHFHTSHSQRHNEHNAKVFSPTAIPILWAGVLLFSFANYA